MTDEYRIRPDGSGFKIVDDAGDTISIYDSEQ
jgi:hypothetical protein